MLSGVQKPIPAAIISGGQTGVDRAALDFAMNNNLDCGGWCPLGRRSEDGLIPEKYQLTETASKEYPVRTRKNILSSHGTLIITKNGYMDRGTQLTQEQCEKLQKPCRVAGSTTHRDKQEFIRWISDHNIRTLNVAGCRESSQPGIYDYATKVLEFLFS